MPKKLRHTDPAGAYRRKAVAARRFGFAAHCACGERRPEALIPGTNPVQCASCDRNSRGATTTDNHHFAGKANNPTTIPVPVNDHRACLSVAQEDWPKTTRNNPLGSPLLAGAASLRGFSDTVIYLVESGLLWVAEMLENLDALMIREFGPQWWVNSEIDRFVPKDKSDGSS